MALRLIGIVALCFVARVATAQSAGLPPVRVVGPLPVSADSYPFGAADHTRVPEDLKKVGYVEEEFLVSGVANHRERLRTLYPTHAAYVDAVRKNVADLVRKRFMVREDGEQLVSEAQKSPVP